MYFVVYKDRRNEWRWTLHANNHRKIANSDEGYKSKFACMWGIYLVKSTNTRTPVIFKNNS